MLQLLWPVIICTHIHILGHGLTSYALQQQQFSSAASQAVNVTGAAPAKAASAASSSSASQPNTHTQMHIN